MRLVPSGNRRRMVAQSLDSGPELGVDFGQGEGVETPMQSGPESDPNALPVPEDDDQEIEKAEQVDAAADADNTPDITEYIFNKLVGFGYPERRLDEYEDEFVKEKIHADGSREITITVPDRYYGSKKRLSSKDFSTMVNELKSQFGLEFVDADRSDMKIIMNFNTRSPESENADAIPAEDTLSEVYGPGKSDSAKTTPSKRKRKAKAYTLRELMKVAKKKFYEDLGDK